jgi:hypothetical protein
LLIRSILTAQRAWLAAVLCAVVSTASAQPDAAPQSRADLLRAARAAKARLVSPYRPGLLEKLSAFASEKESGGKPLGWYPYLGSIYPGGSVAIGAGYRLPLFDTGQIELEAAASYRLYKKVEVRFDPPRLADGRVRIRTRLAYIDAPKVKFFGVGNASSVDDRTTFAFNPVIAGATASFAPVKGLTFGSGVDYWRNETGRGKLAPSIEERFVLPDVPGLGVSPDYFAPKVFAEVDTRAHRGYSTSGGYYRAELAYFDADRAGYSFRRLDAEASHRFPILRANWVVALRGLVTMTGTASGQVVPYFFLPALGNSRDLRAYDDFRFRDRHRLALTGEYRWTPSRLLDMALFVDAGKVASTRGDLNLSDLHADYGLAARLHTGKDTILRLELARGSEGFKLVFGVGPNF